MKKDLSKKIFISIVITSFLTPLLVFGYITIPNPLSYSTFEELVDKIIAFILWIAIAVAPIMLLYSGFLFVTAAGDSQKITQAKTIILYTIIGFAIVLLAKGLITALESILGATPTT